MWDWIKKLEELKDTPHALVTLISCLGSTPREVGAKMIVQPDGRFFGTIGGGKLEQMVLAETVVCLQQGESQRLNIELCPKTGQCCGGAVEVFVEIIRPRPKLLLFGAGHVGQALARTLQGTVFEVHVIDERPEWIDSESLPETVIRHKMPWEEFSKSSADWDSGAYVAIMTHSHDLDQALVETYSGKSVRYLGLIGSASKWRRFQNRLELKGVPKERLAKVKCPIGLPLGGKSPQDLAISVASELLQIYNRELQ